MLAQAHNVRNRGEYEGILNLNERFVADLIIACQAVAAKLDALPPISARSS